uniref:NAD-dependent protein deacylase n=2 Tax=Clastoptera arizonana TaxID=38151 RepID=A0A1B6DGT2_9HEMI
MKFLNFIAVLMTFWQLSTTQTVHPPPITDMETFRTAFHKAKHIVVITGAGISAGSGIPTFRGPGGLWRNNSALKLATYESFMKRPSLVWEFYHYRRELVLTKKPNAAHLALAQFEKYLEKEGLNRSFTLITQNVDGLHIAAGSRNVIELHGDLFKTKCLKCKQVVENRDSPICEALRGRGDPSIKTDGPDIPEEKLPRCKNESCNGLLRPHIVWFGEYLDKANSKRAESALNKCDFCLVIGTCSKVYPAALYARELADDDVPIAEFNIEETEDTYRFRYHLRGESVTTVPEALKEYL